MEPEVTLSMDGVVNDSPLVGQFAAEDEDKPYSNLTRTQDELGGMKVDRITLRLEGGGKRLAVCRHPLEAMVLTDNNGGQVVNPLFHADVPAGADKAVMDDAWRAVEHAFLNPPPFDFAGLSTGVNGGG